MRVFGGLLAAFALALTLWLSPLAAWMKDEDHGRWALALLWAHGGPFVLAGLFLLVTGGTPGWRLSLLFIAGTIGCLALGLPAIRAAPAIFGASLTTAGFFSLLPMVLGLFAPMGPNLRS